MGYYDGVFLPGAHLSWSDSEKVGIDWETRAQVSVLGNDGLVCLEMNLWFISCLPFVLFPFHLSSDSSLFKEKKKHLFYFIFLENRYWLKYYWGDEEEKSILWRALDVVVTNVTLVSCSQPKSDVKLRHLEARKHVAVAKLVPFTHLELSVSFFRAQRIQGLRNGH